jgi:hypothetical protein
MEELRKELVKEIRALRPIQEQAAEDLIYAPAVEIQRRANTAISATLAGSSGLIANANMGMPETLRRAADKEEGK